MAVSGQFVDGANGRILLVCHEPAEPAAQAVIIFPALAEEMNKGRRLLWSVGQQLAAQGVLTVMPDLFGTGDSEGDFADATWQGWVEDIAATLRWVQGRDINTCHALLVRLGACLYSECAGLFGDRPYRVAAWQPESSGADALRQLLRLKVMSDRITWGKSTKLAELREQLDDHALEIGGYSYSPGLADAIERSRFDWTSLPAHADGAFFDWSRTAAGVTDTAPSEVDGHGAVRRVQVDGQKFWTAVEPEDNPGLTAATAAFLLAAG